MKTSKRQIESGIFETLERGDGTRKRVSLQPSYSALVTWGSTRSRIKKIKNKKTKNKKTANGFKKSETLLYWRGDTPLLNDPHIS